MYSLVITFLAASFLHQSLFANSSTSEMICGEQTPQIIEKARLSSVEILLCGTKPERQKTRSFQYLYERHFSKNGEQSDPELICSSLGSGFIYSKNQVITNRHVALGPKKEKLELAKIIVVLPDRSKVEGELIQVANHADLAGIQLKEDIDVQNKFRAIEFGNGDALVAGDVGFAVGQPFGNDRTVTSWMVSMTHRIMPAPRGAARFIQLDGTINPGNSGGGSFNCLSQLVGVNTAIIAPKGVETGLALMIPSNIVHATVPFLFSKEKKFVSVYLGINMETKNAGIGRWSIRAEAPEEVVVEVFPKSLGEQMGLQEGDVIVAVNSKRLEGTIGLLPILIEEIPKGNSFTLTVKRGLQEILLESPTEVVTP